MRALIVPLFLSMALSACGFHLRGMIDKPSWLNNVAIIIQDGNLELASILKSQFEGYSIQVNPNLKTAQYWLMISRIDFQQQIISVGASTNPRQYQLILTIEFTLQTPKGQIIKPNKRVIVSRQLTVNNDRILGSNQEEAVLMSEMRRDAVIQIINSLNRH